MKLHLLPFTAFIVLSFFSGCISPPAPHSEFVKTISFSSLDSFSYQYTLVTGIDVLESDKLLLDELSRKTITSELQKRNFESVNADADFFVVVKWKKAVSTYPGGHSNIYGVNDSLDTRKVSSYRFPPRMYLTLEIYESRTGNLFWLKELPNIFEAIEMREELVVDSLKKGIQNFPVRIEKDPNLPNIE